MLPHIPPHSDFLIWEFSLARCLESSQLLILNGYFSFFSPLHDGKNDFNEISIKI